MADLWTRPASIPYRFATDAGARVEPIAGRKASGWVPGEPVSAFQANDLWGVGSDWIVLLESIAAADGTLATQVLELYDTGATPALAAKWEAGSVANSAKLTCDTGVFEFRPKGEVGPRATAAADGVRYGYDSSDRLQIVYDVSPQSRAYMVQMVTLSASPCTVVTAAGSAAAYNPDAGTAQQAVFRSQLQFPAESTQTGRFPIIKQLTGTFTGATDDLEIAVIRITRSSGAETSLGLIKSSAATNLFGGGVTTAPLTYTYALEFRSAAALPGGGLTTDGVRNVLLTVDWISLNPSL